MVDIWVWWLSWGGGYLRGGGYLGEFSAQLVLHRDLFTNTKYFLLELAVLATCLLTQFAAPPIFGIIVLDKNAPLHRFIAFLVNGGAPLNISVRMLPVIVFSTFAGFKAAGNVGFYISTGAMYLQCVTTWVKVITPESAVAMVALTEKNDSSLGSESSTARRPAQKEPPGGSQPPRPTPEELSGSQPHQSQSAGPPTVRQSPPPVMNSITLRSPPQRKWRIISNTVPVKKNIVRLRRTPLGLLEEGEILQAYKAQQLLNASCNIVYSSPWIVQQAGTFLIFAIFTSFFCIRLHKFVNPIITGIIFVAMLGDICIVWIETYFMADVSLAGDRFLKIMRESHIRQSETKRSIIALWNVHFKIAHPLFLMKKRTFLTFMRALVDFTLTMILNSK
ncbi:hypothetical protein Fcan01_22838 [Folsomia candida]|uniref:Uncharacterized protein n=1 Tax=Folsomia candida TaxID=158441 RepID=A0A226D9K7_FOLCA|nr:hypothetical protein Fcan01_22838 [Folsomia candida]